MSAPVLIRDVAALRRALKAGHTEFFITLNGGARSSKTIHECGKKFDVFHSISDSWETLSASQLFSLTNIGAAMDSGAFYAEGK